MYALLDRAMAWVKVELREISIHNRTFTNSRNYDSIQVTKVEEIKNGNKNRIWRRHNLNWNWELMSLGRGFTTSS